MCFNNIAFLFLLFLSEVLETVNFQRLNQDDIKYLERVQVSCVSLPLCYYNIMIRFMIFFRTNQTSDLTSDRHIINNLCSSQ